MIRSFYGRFNVWSMVVGVAAASLAWLIVEFVPISTPRLLLAFLLAPVAGIAVLVGKRIAFRLAVLSLAFIQTPTIKAVFRWRITEIVLWVLLPTALRGFARSYRYLPIASRLGFWGITLYFAYTLAVGLVVGMFHAPRIEVLDFVYHPLLRVFIESARGLAIVSLLAWNFAAVKSLREFETIIRLFVAGGAIAGIYGFYGLVSMQLGLSLPLIPGTLSLPNHPRPFSTFYEPTGLGSFAAVGTILSIYLISVVRPGHRLGAIASLGANILGLMASLSRAAFVGFLTGFLLLQFTLAIRLQVRRAVRGIVVLGLLMIPSFTIVRHLLPDVAGISLSTWWFYESMKDRIEVYQTAFSLVREFPLGIGQGMLVFFIGGAAGFARLLIEGGLLASLLLLVVHAGIGICSLRLLWTNEMRVAKAAPYVIAAYLVTVVTTINYINTTDAWIWFIWTLPLVLDSVRARHALIPSSRADRS